MKRSMRSPWLLPARIVMILLGAMAIAVMPATTLGQTELPKFKGEKSESDLNNLVSGYVKDMGLDPRDKLGELAGDLVTPEAIKSAQEYKEQMDGLIEFAGKIERGEVSSLVEEGLRSGYEKLKAHPKAPRGMPGLDLIDKLWTTVKLAVEMRNAAKANEVAGRGTALFNRLAKDTSLASEDAAIPDTIETALKVFNRYYGGEGGDIDAVLRHQFNFSGTFSEAENQNCEPGNLAMRDLDRCPWAFKVVYELPKLIKFANEFKKAWQKEKEAMRLAVDLKNAYSRWGHVTGNNFSELLKYVELERKIQASVPRYQKLLEDSGSALTKARTGLGKDVSQASAFCSEYLSAVWIAHVTLRDWSAKQYGTLTRQMSDREKEIRRFCDSVSDLHRKAEDEASRTRVAEYQREQSAPRKACSGGGALSGASYKGPESRDLVALVAEIEDLMEKGELPPESVPSFGLLDQWSADRPADAGTVRRELAGLSERLRTTLGKVVSLYEAYREARVRYSAELNAAMSAIGKEQAREQAQCERLLEEARKANRPAPDCQVCSSSAEDRLYSIKSTAAPTIVFASVSERLQRWGQLHRSVLDAARRAEGGFSAELSALRFSPRLAAGPGSTGSDAMDRRYADTLKTLKGASDSRWLIDQLRIQRKQWYGVYEAEIEAHEDAKAAFRNYQAADRQLANRYAEDVSRLASRAGAIKSAMEAAAQLMESTPWFRNEARDYRRQAAGMEKQIAEKRQVVEAWQKGVSGYGKMVDALRSQAERAGDISAAFGASAVRLERIQKTLDERTMAQLRTLADDRQRKVQYVSGIDAAKRQTLLADLRKALADMKPLDRSLAPFMLQQIETITKFVDAITPLPADALLIDDGKTQSLLRADFYKGVEGRIRALVASDADSGRALVMLEAELKNAHVFQSWEIDHPVHKAFQSAMAAAADAAARISRGRSDALARLKTEFDAIDAEVAPGRKPPLAADAVNRLRERINALNKSYDALPGVERDKLPLDIVALHRRLDAAAAAARETAQAGAESSALAQLREIDRQAQATPQGSGAVEGLMSQAMRIAGEARIGGHPEVAAIMGRLSARRGGSSAPPSGALAAAPGAGGGQCMIPEHPSPAAMAGPEGEAESRREAHRILQATLDCLTSLQRDVGMLDGPDMDAEIRKFMERANRHVEQAHARLSRPPINVAAARAVEPQYKPRLDQALAQLQRAAAGQRAAIGGPPPPAPGSPMAAPGHPPAPSGGMPQADASAAIRELYQKFAEAYQRKDVRGITRWLGPKWTTAGGISVTDLEETLGNSFRVFDSIQFQIQGLQIQKATDSEYRVSYTALLTGRINRQNLRHEDKSQVTDTVSITPEGPRITRTAGNNLWGKK